MSQIIEYLGSTYKTMYDWNKDYNIKFSHSIDYDGEVESAFFDVSGDDFYCRYSAVSVAVAEKMAWDYFLKVSECCHEYTEEDRINSNGAVKCHHCGWVIPNALPNMNKCASLNNHCNEIGYFYFGNKTICLNDYKLLIPERFELIKFNTVSKSVFNHYFDFKDSEVGFHQQNCLINTFHQLQFLNLFKDSEKLINDYNSFQLFKNHYRAFSIFIKNIIVDSYYDINIKLNFFDVRRKTNQIFKDEKLLNLLYKHYSLFIDDIDNDYKNVKFSYPNDLKSFLLKQLEQQSIKAS